MSAKLIQELRSLADCDARAGEPLGKCMRVAADYIEAAEARAAELERERDEARALAAAQMAGHQRSAHDATVNLLRARKAERVLEFYADPANWKTRFFPAKGPAGRPGSRDASVADPEALLDAGRRAAALVAAERAEEKAND